MKRRGLAMILLPVITITTILGGCGKTNSGETAGAGAGTEAKATAESAPIEIDMVTYAGVTLPEQNFINEALEEKLGVKINFEILGAGGDYAATLNTRIAGGDVPDLFIAKDSFYQYADTGVIMSLSDYTEQLKPVMDWAGEERILPNMYKGELYSIPKRWRTTYYTWMVRQDWLDSLNMEQPKTLEEALKVAEAITFQDPDKNGKNDTWGYTFGGLKGFNAILNPYDGSVSNDLIIRNGEVTSTLLQPGMKDGLQMCKQWVDAGVVDPDMIANTETTAQEKAIQGQIGMGIYGWASIFKKMFMDNIKSVNPDADWQCVNPMQAKVAEDPGFDVMDVTAVRGDWAVGAHVKEDEAKLNKIIELLNYIVSEEGSRLVSYGIEGRHYNMEDGKVVPTELMSKECDFLWAYQVCFRDDEPYLEIKFPEAEEQVKFIYDIKRYEVYNAAVQAPETFHKADMDTYIEDNIIKFIYGQRDIGEYDTFVQELYDIYDFQTYMDAAKEQLNDQGYLQS